MRAQCSVGLEGGRGDLVLGLSLACPIEHTSMLFGQGTSEKQWLEGCRGSLDLALSLVHPREHTSMFVGQGTNEKQWLEGC